MKHNVTTKNTINHTRSNIRAPNNMDDWAIASTADDAIIRIIINTPGPNPPTRHRVILSILRHPLIPDGTAGFHAGRARRGLPPNTLTNNDSAGAAVDPTDAVHATARGIALERLPDELLAAVLCQLDSETLVRAVPLVCRRWQAISGTLTVGLDFGAWSTWSPGYLHFRRCFWPFFHGAPRCHAALTHTSRGMISFVSYYEVVRCKSVNPIACAVFCLFFFSRR